MNGALGIGALFAGFVFLVYAAKGSAGTQWQGSIAPGPVLGQLFLGRWPYGAITSAFGNSEGTTPIPGYGGNPGNAPASLTPGATSGTGVVA